MMNVSRSDAVVCRLSLRGHEFLVERAARLFVFLEEKAGEPPTLRKSDSLSAKERSFAERKTTLFLDES